MQGEESLADAADRLAPGVNGEEARELEPDPCFAPGSLERFAIYGATGAHVGFGVGHRLETYDEIATRLLVLPTKEERRAALDLLAPELRPHVASYMIWQWQRERLAAAAVRAAAVEPEIVEVEES